MGFAIIVVLPQLDTVTLFTPWHPSKIGADHGHSVCNYSTSTVREGRRTLVGPFCGNVKLRPSIAGMWKICKSSVDDILRNNKLDSFIASQFSDSQEKNGSIWTTREQSLLIPQENRCILPSWPFLGSLPQVEYLHRHKRAGQVVHWRYLAKKHSKGFHTHVSHDYWLRTTWQECIGSYIHWKYRRFSCSLSCSSI